MATLFDRNFTQNELSKFSRVWSEKLREIEESGGGATEKQYTQQFWIGLLKCFGISDERTLLFEREAKRASTQNRGWIDVFWPGMFLVEQKSVNKPLEAAALQADDYLSGGSISDHEWPQYVISCNFKSFVLTNSKTNETWSFTLDELPEYVDQLKFIAGQEAIDKREEEEATIQASKIMARLYQSLVGEDADAPVGEDASESAGQEDPAVERTSIFLTRVLFLLFGDDAGLWENDLFYRFIEERTQPDGSDLGVQIAGLFDYLNTPEQQRARVQKNVPDLVQRFPYVNGGLFAERTPVEYFNAEMRAALLDACRFRWTRISTAIFGSMFQLVKSREARRAAGEHYTAEVDILKTIGPLFLDELRAEADRLIASKSTSRASFARFLDSLTEMRFVDPACGSGNFLQVAYAKLREIETDVLAEMNRREGGEIQLLGTLGTRLSIEQFHGFEINWWPSRIAEVAMFLTEFQADQYLASKVGDAPVRLPIATTAQIVHADALALDWRAEVPETRGKTFIFGNPPFIGQWTKTKAQTEAMKRVWGKDYDGYLDFVTAWFKKSSDFFTGADVPSSSERDGEFAFVSTNSISQGQAVPALFGPLFRSGWRIKFAYRTFPWNSEAPGKAAVHCVITGYTRDAAARQRLFEYDWTAKIHHELQVKTGINAYLLDAANVLITKRSKPLSPELPNISFGSKPVDGGNLIVEKDDYQSIAEDVVASRYLRPFLGAKEMLHGISRWCLWLEDLEPTDISKSSNLRKRLEAVRVMRSESPKKATQELADTPYLFAERRQPVKDYVMIPSVVSETRKFFTATHQDMNVVASNLVFTAEDPDGFIFAIVSSSMFITWQRAVGGRMKNDLRFSNTIVWNNLPLPAVESKLRQQIIEAGRGVLAAREAIAERAGGTRSLADMYNPLAMDRGLLDAHKKLDRLVDKAFGAPKLCTSETQRLELHINCYRSMTTE
ncbi:DNA methyltransferase [Rothia nasimurium]|uniref:DNA methyltransferase n=1 Tax=Rothia nasimurium TaxID=85336 RepID=UPI003C6E5F4F